MIQLAARWSLLAASLCSVWLNANFAFTDQAWVLMGEPPEVYPEWFYLLVGLPLAITAAVGFGAWILALWIGPPNPKILWPMLALAFLGLVVSALAVATLYWQTSPSTGQATTGSVDIGALLFLSPFLMFGQILLGMAVVINASYR